ncbi:hypothetical protein Tco_0062215, partial [Tanacetum coccineum]
MEIGYFITCDLLSLSTKKIFATFQRFSLRKFRGMDKLKNHKKAVKNEQARTREPEEYKAKARKAKPQSKSAK